MKDVNLSHIPFRYSPALGAIQKDGLNVAVVKPDPGFEAVLLGLPDVKKRVWKGIYGIRDLTKICGNRENHKYLGGIRDFTASREAGLAKIWARDAGFLSPVCREFGKLSRPKSVR